jgi:hypothetical protein
MCGRGVPGDADVVGQFSEDKLWMARHLFDYVVFDLDKGRIIDFRLKAWAEQFLPARVAAFVIESDEVYNKGEPLSPTTLYLASRNWLHAA